MKKHLLVFSLLVLCLALPALAEGSGSKPGHNYVGVAQTNLFIRTEQSREANSVGHISSGDKVYIISYEPEWLYVVKGTEKDWVAGYVLRHTVSNITEAESAELPYGATPARYTATITKDTQIYAAPQRGGDALFTLTAGSKVAIIGIEEGGWAKVIYWRQYGYFYLDAVDEIYPVYHSDTARAGDTIAAFMSFYRIDEDGLNPNRMRNIAVACDYISIPLEPGFQFEFDSIAGPYRKPRGYEEGMSYFEGVAVPSTGGGVCQVSSTMYNVLLAVPHGIEVTYRRAHGPSGATYLPHGVDAAVGNDTLDLKFINTFPFTIQVETQPQDGALYIALVKQ